MNLSNPLLMTYWLLSISTHFACEFHKLMDVTVLVVAYYCNTLNYLSFVVVIGLYVLSDIKSTITSSTSYPFLPMQLLAGNKCSTDFLHSIRLLIFLLYWWSLLASCALPPQTWLGGF